MVNGCAIYASLRNETEIVVVKQIESLSERKVSFEPGFTLPIRAM